MTIAEALQKAVEGGYHIHGSDGMVTTYVGASRKFSAWTRHDNDSTFLVPVEETFLDPRFWQALGRALGWQDACNLSISCEQGHGECRRCHGAYWMYQWHCFIQAIADGNTPEVFFANLPASPTKEATESRRASRKTRRYCIQQPFTRQDTTARGGRREYSRHRGRGKRGLPAYSPCR